jgi:hypothetical protein
MAVPPLQTSRTKAAVRHLEQSQESLGRGAHRAKRVGYRGAGANGDREHRWT